jgi:hypothetical protein
MDRPLQPPAPAPKNESGHGHRTANDRRLGNGSGFTAKHNRAWVGASELDFWKL